MKRCLIVDDSRVVRKVARRIVEDLRVPFDPDRTLAIKLDPEFNRLKRHLLELLHKEQPSGFDRNALLQKLVQNSNCTV